MDTLPPTQPSNPAVGTNIPPVPISGSKAKESEGGIGSVSSESFPLAEIGKDIELSKEVVASGVSVHPTVVTIPPNVQQMGVAPAGSNVTVSNGASVTLPLTDDQIAEGLHQNVKSSWRWLAEWCVRKLKQVHIVLKTIGGKTVEVKVD